MEEFSTSVFLFFCDFYRDYCFVFSIIRNFSFFPQGRNLTEGEKNDILKYKG